MALIWRFELVARRHAGHAVTMDISRRHQGAKRSEVHRDLNTAMSTCSSARTQVKGLCKTGLGRRKE